MASIFLVCPTCKKKGYIEVPDEKKKDCMGGILAIDLEANFFCPHSFIVYLDGNFTVRECVIPDFRVELPEITLKEQIETKCLPEKAPFDIVLIKLNLSFTLLAAILKSVFFKEKIVVISDQEFLHEHIFNFFKDITQDSFGIDITIVQDDIYKNNKKKYKDYIVLGNQEILRDDKKIIDPKKLKVEKQIINNFFATTDLVYCYIMLKNEINKAFELSKSISDSVLDSKNEEELNQQILLDKLIDKYKVKLSKTYLTFLCEIAKNYFEIEDSRIFYPSKALKSFWNS